MKQYEITDVKKVLLYISEICVSEKDLLTEIDSKLGDGDMGISMSHGAKAIRDELAGMNQNEQDITKLLLSCAAAFNRSAPSTLGTLLSFGMMAIGKEINHSEFISEEIVVTLPEILAKTISLRGKSQVGDKTILDALHPYADMLKHTYKETGSFKGALIAAAKAGEMGMESTKGIKARTGRASWLDTRNMEYPDAGAVLCTLVTKKMAELAE